MNKNFVMLSGIPRSGSQVLLSTLNQHPEIHATTTSPVVDMIEIFNNNWPTISAALVNTVPEQYSNMIEGMIDGAYKHITRSTIIDKNRLWPRYGKLMHQVLGFKPKIICTVRPIPEILSSFILLIQKNNDKVTYIDKELNELKLPVNNKNRCRLLWEKYLTHPYTSLRVGFNSPDVDIHVVSYDDIVNDTQNTVNKICDFIGIESVTIDPNNLQPMNENDEFHGGLKGLHHVRSVMYKVSPSPTEVIGHELVKYYTDMNLDFWNK